MALAIDASSPARATATTTAGTITTAAFDPPACILVVATGMDGNNPTATITNNGAALTWNTVVARTQGESGNRGGASLHYAVLAAGRTGMTVTLTSSLAQQCSIKVYCVTGADTSDPTGGVTEGETDTEPFTTGGFTIESASSLGFFCFNDWVPLNGTWTSSDTTFDAYMTASQQGGGSGYKTLGAAGGSATFNASNSASGAVEVNWVSFELEAANTATTATAENAAGTGTANNASIKVTPNAGHASGTGLANNAAPKVTPNAGHSAGTGSAETPGTMRAVGAATGTGTANQPAAHVKATTSSADGTGTANNATAVTAVIAAAGAAEGTGTANQPSISVRATTNSADGSGAANTPGSMRAVGAAEGTGTANQPSVSVKSSASTADGTGEAYDADGGVLTAAPAGAAEGTGTANNAAIHVKATASTADGAGTANTPGTARTPATADGAGTANNAAPKVTATAATADGTGTANNATGQTADNTIAPAEAAEGSGTANNATPVITAGAGTADGTGTANGAAPKVTPNAGAATGTGQAHDTAAPHAPVAEGSGAANLAGAKVTVNAGVASGSGDAFGTGADAITIGAAEVAGGDGAALDASILVAGQRQAGGWHSLLNILEQGRRDAAEDRHAGRACPHCGEPYRHGPHGEPFCPFDGYSPKGRDPSTGQRDWGGLVAALTVPPGAEPQATLNDRRAGWGP